MYRLHGPRRLRVQRGPVFARQCALPLLVPRFLESRNNGAAVGDISVLKEKAVRFLDVILPAMIRRAGMAILAVGLDVDAWSVVLARAVKSRKRPALDKNVPTASLCAWPVPKSGRVIFLPLTPLLFCAL